MLRIFIERPVLSTVISIIIVVLGIIGVSTLPVEQYPNIAPPTIVVSTNYSGANADVVMNSVIIPLEEQINGVEGMTYMTSTASNGGMGQITIYFKQGIDPDIAAVMVQNLANQATSFLPQEVIRSGITVKKQQSSNILMLSLESDNPDYNGRFIQNYANINIIPQIQRVQGVGLVNIYGAQTYSMRIWLKPDVMAAYQISPTEVIAALQDQNIEAAPGELGQNSNQSFQYTLKYTGRLKSVDEFSNIIVRSQNGRILRLNDVANVELGSLNYTVNSKMNGHDVISMSISQTAGSNAQDVINNIKAELAKAEKNFPPGLKVVYLQDANEFLSASIEKVIHTLVEAFLLVFIVVFIFLQDFRSTLIPAIAVPVAIIGSFFFLQLFGFSINLLTLFAMVLAIGIVVDDAIVVVEAVHAKLDAGEKSPKKAALDAMTEIAPAIISITLVMASVFVPVSFIGGTAGIFYKQFGLTLAIAIIISAVNALTLSPALSALFLKAHQETDKNKKKNLIRRFFDSFNKIFAKVTDHYKSTLRFLGKKGHRWITGAIILVFSVILIGIMKIMPTGFVPQEDSGGVLGMVTLPPGSSLERTEEVMKKLEKISKEIPHVKYCEYITGVNFMSGLGSSYGTIILKMEPWQERDITVSQVAAMLKQKTDSVKDATFIFFGMPTIQGFGLSSGVEIQMQDQTGGDIHKFFDITSNFLNELKKHDEVMMAMTTFNPNFPQKEISVDIAKIKAAGLNLNDVMTTLQAYIGSMYISNFNLYGKQFRVMLQAPPGYRERESSLDGLFVKTGSGKMSPITEFISVKSTTGPQSRTRFNMFSSMAVTIIPNYMKGKSSGDVIKLLDTIGEKTLPAGYTYDYSGMTREEANSGNQTFLIFALSLIFVYLLLAALYESYILPLAIILSLPIGLAGVFIFIFIAMLSGKGIVNNIYVQISLIMLIGLLAKNAILIVEYAAQRRKQGMSIVDAAVSGAVARLRPILMTSFAFIFGLFPLAIATGAGAIGNKSIGISAIGGMLFGTIIGILVIPSLYIIFQSIQEKFNRSGLINTDEDVI